MLALARRRATPVVLRPRRGRGVRALLAPQEAPDRLAMPEQVRPPATLVVPPPRRGPVSLAHPATLAAPHQRFPRRRSQGWPWPRKTATQ
jgi:hypothetical protein